jgi:hypothetical protein
MGQRWRLGLPEVSTWADFRTQSGEWPEGVRGDEALLQHEGVQGAVLKIDQVFRSSRGVDAGSAVTRHEITLTRGQDVTPRKTPMLQTMNEVVISGREALGAPLATPRSEPVRIHAVAAGVRHVFFGATNFWHPSRRPEHRIPRRAFDTLSFMASQVDNPMAGHNPQKVRAQPDRLLTMGLTTVQGWVVADKNPDPTKRYRLLDRVSLERER